MGQEETIVLRIKTLMDNGDVKGAVKEMQSSFSRLGFSDNISNDFDKIFKDIIKEAEQFESRVNGSFEKIGDVNTLKKNANNISGLFSKLTKELSQMSNKDMSEIFNIDVSGVTKINKKIEELQQKISQISSGSIEKINSSFKELSSIWKNAGKSDIIEQLKSGDLEGASASFEKLEKHLIAFTRGGSTAKAALEKMMSALNTGDIQSAENALSELLTQAKGADTTKFKKFGEEVIKIGTELTNAKQQVQQFGNEIVQLQDDKMSLIATKTEEAAQNLRQLNTVAKTAGSSFEKMEQSVVDSARATQTLQQEIQEVGNRAAYFLSLENMVDLFRQGIQKAIDTVKELDKAMTETAVVTDFGISDMWDALPRYTKTANELGTTTLGAYETMTLFYQQGLKTNEVFEIGTETMKMARIAGLDYADATNLMTAALRGFNMELNEVSAQKINDVYSELAAITAADTNEIATAMTKTASIAANANMEFETTAALLSQIIETTREPAETAGTAMKTIIARFTEMKKSASDIVNVEGEEVNVNKVEAALRDAGVALRDASGEFRDLDDVFLELSSKWDNLDQMTQRYVATMAAGSRQQSRFIAMMQDYERTMELVGAAYDSTGASQKQFEKTQESLESKLNKLNNAFDTFLMGIADDKIIKGFVDVLTELISQFNKATEKVTGLGGSLLRLGTVFAGLRLARLGIDKAVIHFINLKKGIDGAAGSAGKLTLLTKLTQKINNFKLGQGFVLDVDVDKKSFETKKKRISSEWSAFINSLNSKSKFNFSEFEKFDDGTSKLFMKSAKSGEIMEAKLSAAGTAALLAGKSADEFGEELAEAGLEGASAQEILQKELAQTQAQLEIAKKRQSGKIRSKGQIFTWQTDADKQEIEVLTKKTKDLQQDLENVGDVAEEGTGSMANGFKIASKSILPVLGYITAITAVLAAMGAAMYLAWKNSESQKAIRNFEAANLAAKHFQDRLDEVTNSVNELKEAWDSLSEQQATLDNLTKGTIEWNEALNNYNNTILEVIKNHKDLVFTIDESTGKYNIDKNDYQDYLKIQEQIQKEAQLNSYKINVIAEYSKFRASKIKLREAETTIDNEKHYQKELDENQGGIIRMIHGIKSLEAEKSKNIALAELGLTENYSQEEFETLENEKFSQYQKQTKNAQYIYLFDKYGEEISNAAASLTSSIDASLFDRQRIMQEMKITDDLLSDGISKSNGQSFIKEWAKNNDYKYSNGKVYKDGEEIKIDWVGPLSGSNDITNEQIAEEIVISRMNNIAKRRAENVSEVLSNANEIVSSVFSGNWKNVDEDFISNIIGDGTEDSVYLNNYIGKILSGDLKDKAIGELTTTNDQQMIDFLEAITNKSFEELSADTNYIGKTVSQIISDAFVEKAEAIEEAIQKQKESFKIDTTGLSKDDIEYANSYNTTIDAMTLKEIGFLTDLKEGLNSAFNEVVSYNFFNGISQALVELKQLNPDFNTDNFIQAWQQVDWNSPLNSIKNLNQAIEEGSEEVSYYATEAKKLLSDNFLNSVNQFKEVLNSQDFEEANQELIKLYQTEGEITFDNIKEAASSSNTLKLMLEEGTITATGFAKAMELVANGTYDVTQLTSGLIDALSGAFSLMDSMDQAYSWVTEKDFGKDYSDIGKSYLDAAEAVKSLAKGGAYGNPQFDKYMEFLVGEAEWNQALKKYNGDTKKAYKSKEKQVNNSKGTLLSSWQSTIKDNDTTKNLAVSMGSNGLLKFDLTNISSTDELVENIKNNTSKTEEEARALVADAANYSSELSNALERLDKIKAINILLNTKKAKDVEGGKQYTITDAEMESLGVDEDFINSLETQEGYSIKVWSEEEKKLVMNDISTSIEDALKTGVKAFEKTEVQIPIDTGGMKSVIIDELEDLKQVSLQAGEFTIPDDIQKEIQTIFNEKVDTGVENGLTLDDAKAAAIEGVAQVVGVSNAEYLATGLEAGYQDKRGMVAAAKAAAAQGKQLYITIYTSIVNAITNAFKKFSGLDFSIKDLTKTTGDDGSVYYQDGNGNQYTEQQYDLAKKFEDIANGSFDDATTSADNIFSVENSLVSMYGVTEDQAKQIIEDVKNGDVKKFTVDDLNNIVLPNGQKLGDIYKNAGYTGTQGQDSGSDNKEKNDTNPKLENLKQKLENIERKYENGEMSAIDYETSKMSNLTQQKTELQKDVNKAYQNSKYKDYIYYDKESDSYLLDEKKFNSVKDPAVRNDIVEEQKNINGKNSDLNDVEDAILQLKDGNQYDTTNEKSTLEALDRLYDSGRISSKKYSQGRQETLDKQKSKLKNDLDSRLEESEHSDMFVFNEELGTLLINQEKFNQLSEESQKAVLEEYEIVKGINDELNQIKDDIKKGKEYLRYNTSNEDKNQQAFELLYQNGKLSPEVFQSDMMQANTQERQREKGNMNKILSKVEEDMGAIYFDELTDKFEINPLANLEGEELEKAKKQQEEFQSDWDKILGMKSGPEKTKAKNEFLKKYRDSIYTNQFYKNKSGILAMDELWMATETSKEVKDNGQKIVDEFFESWMNEKEDKWKNEELTARKQEDQHVTYNDEEELRQLELKYKSGEIGFDEFIAQRDVLYNRIAEEKEDEALYQYENSQYKKYLSPIYDEISGELKGFELNEEERENFEKLGDSLQEDILNEANDLSTLTKEVQEIRDIINDYSFVNLNDRIMYWNSQIDAFNAQGDMNSLNRKRQELSGYNTLIGKVPSQFQGPLNLITGAANMLYEAEENQILRRQEEDARKDFQSQWNDAIARGFEDYLFIDEATGEVQINKELIEENQKKGILDSNDINEIMNIAKKADDSLKKANEYQQQRSGGIFQEPFYLAEKSIKTMSIAFKDSGDTSKDVKEAFDELEKSLGLSSNALDDFEETLVDIIENSGIKDATIKGLGKDDLLNVLENSKFGQYMGESTKDFLGMILGSEETTGMDFAKTGLNAFGEILGLAGDTLSFDMIGQSLDMINTVKSIIDQIKNKIEELIGYITQSTQILVETWTGREDYLYNFLKQIEKHLQEYEKLQRYSTQLEKGRLSSSQDILDNWNAQWKSLQLQLEEQTERLETRQEELNRSRINPFALISGWDPTSDTLYENREVKMIWDIIIGLGEAFAPLGTGAFFTQLNQLYDDYDQRVQNSYADRLAAEQALLDLEDQRLELVKVGADEATEFETKLLESLIQKEQEAIDELSRLNDAVTDANSKLLSTLRDNLDKIRQDRENEKREEELGEKERRLAYLRQDTSGANLMEIKKLEEELDKEYEDYTDTLIDQKISELEKQNELAADQRQQQIDLLQGQLDYAEKYGLYWDAVYGMLYTIDENGVAILNPENFDPDGNIRENSELAQLLGTFSDRMGMSTWSSVLDNEETKRLGRYYGAFIGMNGVEGNWANRWALLNPGVNDPNYAYPQQEIPDGLLGVLYKLEMGIKEYFGNSNLGLVNGAGRIDQSIKNFFGKMFGYDEWANYDFSGFNPAHVESTIFAGIKNTTDDMKVWFTSGFDNLTKGIKNSNNIGGTQNYGAVTENYNFNIGTVGENISVDDMVDRVTSAIKGMFATNINAVKKGR